MNENNLVGKSKPISIRIGMSLFNFLSHKAIERELLNEKGKPIVGSLIAEKAEECFIYGWDKPRELNIEGINQQTKSDVLAEMGLVHEESLRYKALCQVIDKKSHNGLKFYMKEVDKILHQNKTKKNV